MPEHRSRPSNAASITDLSVGRTRRDQIRGGNHGLTPEQVAGSQRERVLAAMRELVISKGFQAVPVADVIRHAGVSRKTFYELWRGKEECFVALYEREMERVLAPTLQAFEGDEPWRDRLRTALGVLLGVLAADASRARICFVEVLAAGPLALAARNAAMAQLGRLVAPPGEGALESSRALTAGGVGYLSETLNREVASGRAAELPALRGQLVDGLTRPFAPGDTADSASEGAFLAAYGEIAADLLGRVSAAIATDDPPPDRVRAGVAALLAFCAEEPDRARASLVEALSAGPAARDRRLETNRRLSELFAQPLRELRPSDRIAEVSAIALVGGFQELAYDAIDRRATTRLPSVDTVVAVARLDA